MDSYTKNRVDTFQKLIEEKKVHSSSKVLSLNVSINVTQWILPTQQVLSILKDSNVIAIKECGCRTFHNNCNNSKDTCIVLYSSAEKLIANKTATRISLNEAVKILDKSHEQGLIHMAMYIPGNEVQAICSCCTCCCHDLRAFLEYDKKKFIAKSDFVEETDVKLCNNCGACVSHCAFEARHLKDGCINISSDECYGCGLCIDKCPSEAIKLVEKESKTEV